MGGFHVSVGTASGFSADAQTINLGGDYSDRDQPFVVDRLWLEEAELVIVRATHDGSVRRTLEIREFPAIPSPASRAPPAK